MDNLILENINQSDAAEVLALMTESFNENDPFAASGDWTKLDYESYFHQLLQDYLVA